MKIAVIGVKGLPASQGGIEHYCQALYPGIVERGHTVDLYARSSYINKPWFSVSEYQGVRVICLPSLPVRGLDALTSSGFAAMVAALKGYDVVHFHALGPSIFSFIPRFLSSAKVITTCQGLDWQREKWGELSSRLILLGEKMAAKYAHNIIVVSEALKTYFQKTYDVDAVYIPNGPGIYAESDPNFSFVKSLGLKEGNYLLFLGRLVPEKRPELLIKAFQKLDRPDWKLVLQVAIVTLPTISPNCWQQPRIIPTLFLQGNLGVVVYQKWLGGQEYLFFLQIYKGYLWQCWKQCRREFQY